jgi:hypothetical protein
MEGGVSKPSQMTAQLQAEEWLKQIGPPIEGDVLLSDKNLRDILGGCSQMKIRRLRESKGLPGPTLRLNGKSYTPRSMLQDWLKARIAEGTDYCLPHHLKGRPPVEQREA